VTIRESLLIFYVLRCDLYQPNLSYFWDFRKGSPELVSTIHVSSLHRTEFSVLYAQSTYIIEYLSYRLIIVSIR